MKTKERASVETHMKRRTTGWFRGRIPRSHFLLGLLAMNVVTCVIAYPLGYALATSNGFAPLVLLALVGLMFLSIAWIGTSLHVRRWHDLDRPGWMFLLNFTLVWIPIGLVWLGLVRGTRGSNRFGRDPFEPDPTNEVLAAGSPPGTPAVPFSQPYWGTRSLPIIAVALLSDMVLAIGAAFCTALQLQRSHGSIHWQKVQTILNLAGSTAHWGVLVGLLLWTHWAARHGGLRWLAATVVAWASYCLCHASFTVNSVAWMFQHWPLWIMNEDLLAAIRWTRHLSFISALALLMLSLRSRTRISGTPVPASLVAGAWVGILLVAASSVVMRTIPVQEDASLIELSGLNVHPWLWWSLIVALPLGTALGFLPACLLHAGRPRAACVVVASKSAMLRGAT